MENRISLNSHCELLLQQYHELLPTLQRLSDEAYEQLRCALSEQGIYVTAIEHRVKTEKSLAGKLELKGAKYKSVDDITDLVGLRVITFYTDEVDKVAAIAKRVFDVDWQESVDKRKQGFEFQGDSRYHRRLNQYRTGPHALRFDQHPQDVGRERHSSYHCRISPDGKSDFFPDSYTIFVESAFYM